MTEKIRTDEIILYTSPEGKKKVEVLDQDETVWLTQKQLSELYCVDRSVSTKHLKNIFAEGELVEASVRANFALTALDGKKYKTNLYNLDAIIAVGYRVNSFQATQFRIWATKTLKEFIIKGFVLDDDRLKHCKSFGRDYFDELLERIREIRASERRFYQKITDIYATSADYNKDSPLTKDFFATVQNKPSQFSGTFQLSHFGKQRKNNRSGSETQGGTRIRGISESPRQRFHLGF